LPNFTEVALSQGDHAPAGARSLRAHAQDFADLFQGETKRLSLANKTEAMQVLRAVDSVAGFSARGLREKSSPLVEAVGLNIHAGLFR
jgi:hypothetical protein